MLICIYNFNATNFSFSASVASLLRRVDDEESALTLMCCDISECSCSEKVHKDNV